MIDNGFPLTTEPNILRQMIAPPNIVSKMLSVVTGNRSNVSNTLPGATASCVPWRTTDLKHTNNEVYVDLVEEMDAIINRSVVKGFPLCSINISNMKIVEFLKINNVGSMPVRFFIFSCSWCLFQKSKEKRKQDLYEKHKK